MTEELMLALAKHLNSLSSSLSMGHFTMVSNPRDKGQSCDTFNDLKNDLCCMYFIGHITLVSCGQGPWKGIKIRM